MEYEYTIHITFTTDREITADERADLENACAVQVEEPQVRSEFGYENAEYSVRNVGAICDPVLPN